MAKTLEKTEAQAIEQVLAELRALPAGKKLSTEEWCAMMTRLPRLGDLPDDWSSADDIREFRGPLPEDDPDYQRNIARRR